MRIFKEEQAFRQWWLIIILGGALILSAGSFFMNALVSSITHWKLLGLFTVTFIVILFWIVRLQTKIDANGINARFFPLKIYKRQYKWNEISQCYVRRYSPFQEYGGWGVRGTKNAKAYNVSGNMGIQIITRDRKKFLIGTKKPDEAEKVIKRYQEKFDKT